MKIQITSNVILICLCVLTIVKVEGSGNRILLEKIEALTLYKGKYTTGSRHNPIKQIECVGGDAGCRYEPDVIQCRNVGSDGINPNWKCEADLPKSLKFGRLKVTCEGYDYAEDKYVLRGSCGLKYTLYLTNDYPDQRRKRWFRNNKNFSVHGYEDRTVSLSTLFGIVWLGMIGFIFYNMCSHRVRVESGSTNRRSTYRGFTNRGTSPPRNDTPYPGFWTGMLGGGLLGYLFGRSNDSYIRTRRHYSYDYDPHCSRTTATSYDDDEKYSAYGFAETSNR